jgi:hypothetical protein
MIQTGAKIRSGGVNAGLLRVAYHTVIFGCVKSEPIIPESRDTPTEMTRRITDRNGTFFIQQEESPA